MSDAHAAAGLQATTAAPLRRVGGEAERETP
ncbi:hypothetical protein QFZ82_002064 [Streptomyces sp. V4I23]|nr:hypothetical protein [Streptomyces sp. V4I23]